ncbi:MAG: toll/interleukin-1 receptor domain-containing protein [Planctomycetes bacterium]|nr:toll/interleukin-1 receptor domain-containing protein [Planctomycetota bacterium]
MAKSRNSVFVSHNYQDRELVRDIARRLREAGLKPLLFEEEFRAGDRLIEILRKLMRSADAFLFLITPAALKNAWVVRELGMAEAFGPIVVAVTAGVDPQHLPAPWEGHRIVPFDQLDSAIDMLAEKLTAAGKT